MQELGQLLPIILLLGLCLERSVGLGLDVLSAIYYPFEINYVEGVVIQQLLIIPGPEAYSVKTTLPFVICHYPPIFYLVVRLASLLVPDILAAGRLVTGISVFALAICGGLVVSTALKQATTIVRLLCSITTTCLILALPNIHSGGFIVRVDMLANFVSTLGLYVALSGRVSTSRILSSFALCGIALFVKQTEFSAGIAVFCSFALVRPKATVAVAVAIASVAVSAVVVIQTLTEGGFLLHTVIYNINRFDLGLILDRLRRSGISFPFFALMPLIVVSVFKKARHIRAGKTAHTVILIWFLFTLTGIVGLGKSGGDYNYLNGLTVSSCVLVGVVLGDLLCGGFRDRISSGLVAVVVAGCVYQVPSRMLDATALAGQQPNRQTELVELIASTEKPILSDDLIIMYRAERLALIEPATATELAMTGRWDETALVDLVERDGIAFIVTLGPTLRNDRRSPRLLLALERKFPMVEQYSERHWLHLPPKSAAR